MMPDGTLNESLAPTDRKEQRLIAVVLENIYAHESTGEPVLHPGNVVKCGQCALRSEVAIILRYSHDFTLGLDKFVAPPSGSYLLIPSEDSIYIVEKSAEKDQVNLNRAEIQEGPLCSFTDGETIDVGELASRIGKTVQSTINLLTQTKVSVVERSTDGSWRLLHPKEAIDLDRIVIRARRKWDSNKRGVDL